MGPCGVPVITFGTIFAGGVYDYFTAMSERNEGASIAEARASDRDAEHHACVLVVLLIMVGTVFAAPYIDRPCKNMSGVLTTTLARLIILV